MEKRLSPPEISAKVLMKLKKSAEEYLGQPVTPSPIHLRDEPGDLLANFTPDDARILAHIDAETVAEAYVFVNSVPASK